MKPPSLNIFASYALALLTITFSCQSHAQRSEKITPGPKVFDVWVKTTVPGSAVSAAYMHIKSATPLKLVKAESAIADIAEIHDMKMNAGVMEMKAMDALDIPADKLVDLQPGGLHVMLMKLKKSINKGDKVPLTLTFVGADKKPVVVKVDAIAQEKNSGGHKH